MKILIALVLLFAWSIAASAQTAAVTAHKGAFDKATLEAYLRHLEIYRTPVTFQIDDPKPSKRLPGFYDVSVHLSFQGGSTKDELYYISPDGQTIIEGDVYNIHQSPFEGNLEKLTLKDDPSLGPANAPVTIVEFGDLECPDCRMEAPLLRQNVPETFPDKVRVVFKNYPLESIHPWAHAAAIAGRCVYRQGNAGFWKFYDWIYQTQDEITPDNLNAKIEAWAGQNGLNSAELKSCIDTQATGPEVEASISEGRALDIHGTPTLFINGRKIGGLQWSDLQLVINHELEYLGKK
ncbi:MAG TPA: thioredoxin domain-containing protein [Bryobacteraceae bacterium]|nr:thioredoxin domain-containing protein [Bryobacteraceae bacterium]